jgi:hypothetical protein
MAVRRKVAPRDFVRRSTALGPLQVVADQQERTDLLARYEDMRPHLLGAKFGFRLGEAELDAVRAARCLVEH